ncbi:hypothetical protein F5B21DRAFT_456239 [Xylaria acuta]|nr:hypothetical protein F5B21DRAFT_456239 [Xylaria acuta]
MAACAPLRVTDVQRRRGSRLVAMVMVMVAMMLAHGNIFLVVIVLARGLRAETHIGCVWCNGSKVGRYLVIPVFVIRQVRELEPPVALSRSIVVDMLRSMD